MGQAQLGLLPDDGIELISTHAAGRINDGFRIPLLSQRGGASRLRGHSVRPKTSNPESATLPLLRVSAHCRCPRGTC